MESPLTPALALDYLRELSADVLGAVMLDDAGNRLAGDAGLAPAVRSLLEAAGASEAFEIRARAGWVFGRRSASGVIVLAAAPLALPGLIVHDLAEVVGLLDGKRPGGVPISASEAAPEALRALADGVHDAISGVVTLSSADR